MINRLYLLGWAGLLLIPLLGCASGESGEKSMDAIPSGLRIEGKWLEPEDVLTSETHKPLQFPYALTNDSDQEKVLRLARISCGCAAVSVISGTVTKPLALGSVFTLTAHEKVTVTLDVRLAGKPIGLHNFPTELSVVNAGSERPFSLPEPRVRIVADISADPPVLSHQFRWNDHTVVEKCLSITTRQKIAIGERLPSPKFSSIPNYITLNGVRKIESIESGKYRTEKWRADFAFKNPITEDYTVAATIRVSFPGSLHHTIAIPSVVTAKRGLETRPRSLTLAREESTQSKSRIVLVTATDNRPFSIIRISSRTGLCRAKVRDAKAAVSHLIEVIPVSSLNPPREDTLEIETDHSDTPSITIPLSRAG